MVTSYSISPEVVFPGDTATITVTLTNTANQASKTESSSIGTGTAISSAESVTLPLSAFIESAILQTKDFQVINGWYQDVGNIGPGQSLNLTFFVKAPDAKGVYFPEVWIRVRDSGSIKYPLSVNVNSAYALVKGPSLRIIRDVPMQVIPGSPFNVSIAIENDGLSAAHDINVAVETPLQSISSLTPQQYYFRTLSPGEIKNLDLSFITDKNIPLGIKQFPVIVTFLTDDGKKHETTTQAGVQIQGKGELGVSKYQVTPDQIHTGDSLTIILRIENTGTDDAKSVRASLDIPFEGMKDAFIGTIEPKNDAPAVFDLKASKSGEVSYNLTLQYRDDFGEKQVITPLKIYVKPQEGPQIVFVVLVVILACAGLYLYYRSRHKKP